MTATDIVNSWIANGMTELSVIHATDDMLRLLLNSLGIQPTGLTHEKLMGLVAGFIQLPDQATQLLAAYKAGWVSIGPNGAVILRHPTGQSVTLATGPGQSTAGQQSGQPSSQQSSASGIAPSRSFQAGLPRPIPKPVSKPVAVKPPSGLMGSPGGNLGTDISPGQLNQPPAYTPYTFDPIAKKPGTPILDKPVQYFGSGPPTATPPGIGPGPISAPTPPETPQPLGGGGQAGCTVHSPDGSRIFSNDEVGGPGWKPYTGSTDLTPAPGKQCRGYPGGVSPSFVVDPYWPCAPPEGVQLSETAVTTNPSDPGYGLYCANWNDPESMNDHAVTGLPGVIVQSGVTPPQSSTPPQQASQCCDAANQAIADALKYLADRLANVSNQSVCTTDECLDTIAQKLKDKQDKAKGDCDTCCQRVAQGLATKSECLAIEANCTCNDCLSECSLSDEGLCCKNCGADECTCQEGECKPKTPKPQQFWLCCDNKNGGGYVTQADDNPTDVSGSNDIQCFGPYESESLANQDKSKLCFPADDSSKQPPIIPPVIPPRQSPLARCTIDTYSGSAGAESFLESVPNNFDEVQIVNAGIAAAHKLAEQVNSLTGDNPVGAGLMAATFSQLAKTVTYAPYVKALAGCDSPGFNDGLGAMSLAGFIEHETGMSVKEWLKPVEYAMNATCRQVQLSPDQAMAAYLSGTINQQQLDTFWAIAGYCSESIQQIMVSAKAKPIPQELIRLRRREIIDQGEYADRMRQLGYLESDIPESLYTSTLILPSLSEILHMMIRDADNEPIVQRFRFDDRFDDKFGPQLKEWCKHQGIDESVVKMAYRSHWDIPSKSELFEFWRRLRNLPDGNKAKITQEDLRAALTHNNVLPRWFDSYLAIAFQPLGRIDIRRSYQQGTMSDQECRDALQQLGYSDDNIERLFKFMVKLKSQAALKHESLKRWIDGEITADEVRTAMNGDGFTNDQAESAIAYTAPKFANGDIAKAFVGGRLDANEFAEALQNAGVPADSATAIMRQLSYLVKDNDTVGMYTDGLLTRDTAKARMQQRGIAETAAISLLDAADDTFEREANKRCQNAIKRRFLTGGLSPDQATGQLLTYGVVQERASKLIERWKCESKTTDKHVPATTLCGWLAKGSITADDFVRRMERIGFTHDDAMELLGDCMDRIATKQAKDELHRLKQKQADQAKAEAKARRAQAEGEKALKKIEKAREAKSALRRGRQNQLLTAMRHIVKVCGCTDVQAVDMVDYHSDRLQRDLGFTLDESIRVVLQASEVWKGGEPQSFADMVDAMAKLLKDTAAEVVVPEPA